jgi:serine/threonine protein kinase
MMTAAESPTLGMIVAGKYRLLRLLGRGGHGSVFEAERLSDGVRFALKRIDPVAGSDEIATGRFAREVRAANAAESEHIVRVVDVGSDGGCQFLVMERLDGEDLGACLRRVTRLPSDEAIACAVQVLSGLELAHAKGVVHRDLKPDNVFLAEVPGGTCVKIVDFGMSKIQPLGQTAPLALTMRGAAVGTPLYMSPEQASARADVDARSDLYSVGAILFECVTGRPPHVGESDEAILDSIRTMRAPAIRGVLPTVRSSLAEVIDRALAFERDERFGSAREMLDALLAASRPTRHAGRGRRSARSVWLLAVVALVAGAATTVAAAWWVQGHA